MVNSFVGGSATVTLVTHKQYSNIVDVLDANNNKLQIYLADYSGNIIALDENATELHRTSLGMSVRHLAYEGDSNATIVYAVGSSGKSQGVDFNGSVANIYRLSTISEPHSVYTYLSSDNSPYTYYSTDRGIYVTSYGSSDSISIIKTSASVISTVRVPGYAAQLYTEDFLVALNNDGSLEIFNENRTI